MYIIQRMQPRRRCEVVGGINPRRELVLKLVNGAERERTLELRGLPLSRQWKGEILTADSLMAENTLDHPNLVAPRPWPVRAGSFVTLPPRSLVVVRIPLTPAELRPALVR